MEQTALKFKPDRFRLFSNSFLQFAAGLLIALPIVILIEALLLGAKVRLEELFVSQFGLIFGGAIGAAIGAAKYHENATITISSEYIAGPSLWVGKRVHFLLLTLDRERSGKQNIFLKLFGCRYLVSTTGIKILFAERTFDKNQVAEILNSLGLI